LVLDHDGFGNDRTDATRPCEPGQRDEQMNQEEDDFAHLWIAANCGQNDEFWLNLAIRHPNLGILGYTCLPSLVTIASRFIKRHPAVSSM
jgi:hypothetical protein